MIEKIVFGASLFVIHILYGMALALQDSRLMAIFTCGHLEIPFQSLLGQQGTLQKDGVFSRLVERCCFVD